MAEAGASKRPQRSRGWTRGKGLHLLFTLSLLLLVALATWWSLFISRSIGERRDHNLRDLELQVGAASIRLGHAKQRPAIGPLRGTPDVTVVEDCAGRAIPLRPHFPELCVRSSPQAVHAIEDKFDRQRLMLIGESALLILLLATSIFMFYRLLLSERRVRREMNLFFSTVTHELKTPVAGLRALLQSFQLGRVPDGEIEAMAGMGVREADRLEHLIENILFAGRIRKGSDALTPERVELRPFMTRMLEHWGPLFSGDGQERIHLNGDLDLSVQADPFALRVVLENLMDNAVKYGGDEPIRVQVERSGTSVAIRFVDQGVGFEPEHAEALFDAYRREEGSENPVRHGTGLGLALSRRLARHLGGDVIAESDGPDQGSRFAVVLPGGE